MQSVYRVEVSPAADGDLGKLSGRIRKQDLIGTDSAGVTQERDDLPLITHGFHKGVLAKAEYDKAEKWADLTLERYAEEYASDPECIAEGLAIKVTEEMLKLLEQKGLNQSWLAETMGVSRAHISRILNAPSNMTLLAIAKIAVVLGVTPDICLDTGARQPAPAEQETLAEIPDLPGCDPKTRCISGATKGEAVYVCEPQGNDDKSLP